MFVRIAIPALLLASCSALKSPRLGSLPASPPVAITGSGFIEKAAGMKGWERDSLALFYLKNGNFPDFLKKLVPIRVELPVGGITKKLILFVTPDYMSIGKNENWVRVPLTPKAATELAESLNCILPTAYLVDMIYRQAEIKLEPIPLFAFRDSTPTFYHHHLIIEGQRKQRKGLIAGIKKDIISSADPKHLQRQDRVIIYGWHTPDGRPIQPVYSGHVNWYVDYSHGLRLVYNKGWMDGKWVSLKDINLPDTN